MTTAKQLMQRGRAQILLTLLAQRLGPLPQATIERMHTSPPEELDRIARAVLAAPTLAAVFAD